MIDFFKCPQDWLDFFYREDVKCFIDEQEDSEDKIDFEPFYKIPYYRINVIILSVKNKKNEYLYSINHISKSFQEIYKELEIEGYYPTKDGNIDHWYKNNIFFLDMSCFSIELSIKLIDFLKEKQDTVWLILNSEEDVSKLPLKKNNFTFFKDPLSNSFKGSNIFKNIDKILKSKGLDAISW